MTASRFGWLKWSVGLTALVVALFFGAHATQAQSPSVIQPQAAGCASTYVVQPGDYLVRIAQKELGDPRAYWSIFTATNNAARTDHSFAHLYNPNIIRAGQKLCIPAAKPAATAPTTQAQPTAPAAQGAATGQPGAITPRPVQIYTHKGPAADASALVTTLVLADRGQAAKTMDYVGKSTIVQQGLWAEDGNNVKVNLIDQDGKPISETLTFEPKGDTLNLVNHDPKVYGSQGLTLHRNPFIGTYQTEMPAADASKRVVTLILAPDESATLSQDYVGKSVVTQTGTWKNQGKDALVTLTQQNGKPLNESMTFAWQGDKLAATQYDQRLWGSQGLSLGRVGLPIATIGGFVRYKVFRALTPEAVVAVQLVETKPDGSAMVVSETQVHPAGKQVPIPFQLRFDPTQLASGGSYALRATISEEGKTIFESAQPTPVITRGHTTGPVDLDVTPAQGGATGQAPALTASVSGTVTYRERLMLPADAELAVQIQDVSRADAPSAVIAEQKTPVGGKAPPFAFDIAYDPAKIDARGRYNVVATISYGGKVQFRSTQAYPVITNGTTSNVDIVVQKIG